MRLSWKQIFLNYNLFYFFMMIMYAAQGNEWMRNMYGFTGNILAMALPIVLTGIFYFKNKIRFNRPAFLVLFVAHILWWVAVSFKCGMQNLSLTLFMFLQLCVAYCMAQVYRTKVFFLYEQIVTKLSLICLFVWGINLVVPSLWDSICPYFAFERGDSISKYNFFFASVLNREHFGADGLWYRNPGFSWEPGMNASLVSIAIFINLAQNKFQIKRNKNLYILIAALLSSFSTTGYVILIVCLFPFFLLNKKTKYGIVFSIILIPLGIWLFQLDFMGEKIKDLQSSEYSRTELINNLEYHKRDVLVPQRFDGLAFEWMNIVNDPILGYGLDVYKSYVSTNVSDLLSLSNGILKIFSKYGILFGGFLTIIMFMTCKKLNYYWNCRACWMFFLLYELISVSYTFFYIPLFMAFYYLYIIGEFKEERVMFAQDISNMKLKRI